MRSFVWSAYSFHSFGQSQMSQFPFFAGMFTDGWRLAYIRNRMTKVGLHLSQIGKKVEACAWYPFPQSYMRPFTTDLIQTKQAMVLPYLLILAVLYVSHSSHLSLFACKKLDAQHKGIFSRETFIHTKFHFFWDVIGSGASQARLFWIDIDIFPHIEIEVSSISTSKLTFTLTDKLKLNLIFFSLEGNWI